MPTDPSPNSDRRLQEEMEFHDRRERDRHAMGDEEFESRYSNKKWYSAQGASNRWFDRWIAENARGAVALDYCCGLGGSSLRLARAGAARVFGIDISPESAKTAKALLDREGFGDRSEFHTMDAERLSFPDGHFDVIVCSGVLHHLDLTKALPELNRVLKPGGRIICMEPLRYNPLIQAYRRLTPKLRTAWEADHILTRADLDLARRTFDGFELHFFHLFVLAAVPLRKTPIFRPLVQALDAVDSVAMRVPGLQYMAWVIIFVLSKNRAN
jgi:SAM-dependent methyltransferase